MTHSIMTLKRGEECDRFENLFLKKSGQDSRTNDGLRFDWNG